MRMHKMASLVLATSLLASGCESFLAGPGLSENPNDPVEGTMDQFFAAVVSSQTTQQEGLLARLSGMFVQHFSGIGRQHLAMGKYEVTEGDVNDYFDRVYAGGGLVDVRRVQQLAKDANDSLYAGIGMFWEALNIGMAASIWGDIPYSEAVSEATDPVLDPQEQVYAGVIAKLDTAIAWIPLTGPTNIGPGSRDVVYGGDRTKYVQAANTLKARYMMHWVEAQLTGGASLTAAQAACGGDCLTLARTAALAGINTVANNLLTFHSSTSSEWNIWHQFLVIFRAGDVAAGRALVDTLKARRPGGDNRIAAYFDSVTVGTGTDFRGADQNGIGTPVSPLSDTRINPAFRQPILTAAENSLILAEAEFRLGNTAPARTALNAAKAFSATANGVTVPAVSGTLAGTALRNAIKLEKWISLFQNVEAWNDYKRNCYPVLTPATGATEVPGRHQYGETERQTNANVPDVASQPVRNRNDPKPCSDPTHPL